jgi:hypothetical protein
MPGNYPVARQAADVAAAEAEEAEVLPVRQPGEPSHRCLWCGYFRCHRPMQKCSECSADYRIAAVGMPTEKRHIEPMGYHTENSL